MRTIKLISLLFFVLITSCKKEKPSEEDNLLKFKEYISQISKGIISTKSDIRVVLATPLQSLADGDELDSDILSISPKVAGKVMALDPQTIAFIPDNGFEQDTEYSVKLNLGNLIPDIPKEYKTFTFNVKTLKLQYNVLIKNLQSYDKNWQYLQGVIKTSDLMSLEQARQLIKSEQNGKALDIKFEEENNDAKEFHFKIDSINRPENDSKIVIQWDGSPFNIDKKGEEEYVIPGKNNFVVNTIDVVDGEQQYVEINFSDPLKKGQSLKGLITLTGSSDLSFLIDGNVLKVYPKKEIKGAVPLEIFQGIESVDGYKLKNQVSELIAFEQLKPEVKLLQSGTILPSSSNLKINFEAVSLNAVDVTVMRIFENNVLQFLQTNNLDGGGNLRAVARPIAKKKLKLDNSNGTGKWKAYALDLKELITPVAGAIYRVEFSFKPTYSTYKCVTTNFKTIDSEDENFDEEIETSYWDSSENYYYNNNYEYSWYERDNPCHTSYYRNKKVAANVLASDLGVVVKKGVNNSYFISVTDIVSTQPVEGATVTFYNYQQQELGSQITESNGITFFDADNLPYFAIVSHDNQKTYIKLNDGNALSVSKFDVSGARITKGIKGFIYGERGVWRPGDSIFLTFMLNDKANPLPDNHPVKLELKDPYGKVVDRQVNTRGLNKVYNFLLQTEADAYTGNWQAKVSVGGAEFYKTLKIETIKPNRLKIKADFEADIIVKDKDVKGNLEVKWLHGAIAKNLKADVTAKFSPQNTSFSKFPSYVFDDPAKDFSSEEVVVFDGSIDQEGKADFVLNPKLSSSSPGMLKTSFVTKVYEEGGDFSTDVFTKTYSPYSTYVGLSTPKGDKSRGMLLTDTKHRFDVVTVDENGKPQAKQNLKVKIYKISWRWWWNTSSENLSSYSGSSYKETVFETRVNTGNDGKGSFNFELKYPNWGRYLVRVEDGNAHSTGKIIYIDWPGWAGKSRKNDPSSASMLVISSDKDTYNVGETASITFPSSGVGRALVTVENGSEVIESLWVTPQKDQTKFELPISELYAPNIYVNVTLLQPHASTENDLPIRLYGVIPLKIEDPKTKLQPVVSMPDVLEPEQKVTVKVSEANGQPMTYTLAVVDEGLLDLTRFKTPDPWNTFYQREALGVKTWDVFDDVIGAFGGRIDQIFSIGGDGELAGANNKKANRFKPVVIYKGPFYLEKGKSAAHTIALPKYVGSVRTMVVAGDHTNAAYGQTEKATPVRKPLMLLASLPRKATPGETIKLPVTVFAMEKKVKNVTVKLKSNEAFTVIGSASQTLSFTDPDEKMAYFDVQVNDFNGIGTIKVEASGNGEKASYDVEMDVINPNPISTKVEDVVLQPNSKQTISLETFGVKGSNFAEIEISGLPPMDFNGRMQYLIRYPHGCLEQTTSAAFPQLYMGDIFDLTFNKKKQIEQNIKRAISKVAGMQLYSGGFSYWPGINTGNDWGTSYAGHFLLEAEKKGYVLPIGFKSSWISYQKNQAKQWRKSSRSSDLAQAYRLYTLALAGSPDKSSMNRLRETSGITNEAKLRLAAAYALTGQQSIAKSMVATANIDHVSGSGYDYYTYGSPDRNRAMALEAFVLLDEKTKSNELAKAIAKRLSENRYLNTQTTAYSLLAMAQFAKSLGEKGVGITINLNGKAESIESPKTLVQRTLDIKEGTNSITLTNSKANTVYVRVANSGQLPVGEEEVITRNLASTVSFKNRNGNTLDVSSLSQGTNFVAEITITNTKGQALKDVALTQLLPSGWEIINTRFTDFGGFDENKATYTDIRDDRINFYFDMKARETKTFRVLLNTSYTGTYYLPGIQCEAMYDNDYMVRTKGMQVEVVK